MPRWVHRQKEKICIFTNRKSAEQLEVIAAQAIAADRWQQGEKANTHLNTFGFLPTHKADRKKPKEFKSLPAHEKN